MHYSYYLVYIKFSCGGSYHMLNTCSITIIDDNFCVYFAGDQLQGKIFVRLYNSLVHHTSNLLTTKDLLVVQTCVLTVHVLTNSVTQSYSPNSGLCYLFMECVF